MPARLKAEEMDLPLCAICGNEFDPGLLRCPFCGTKAEEPWPTHKKKSQQAALLHRVVNLERGHPAAMQALDRLDREIALCLLRDVRVLTLIHGYGSSGKGGVIRQEVRRRLNFLQYQGKISEIIEGERFTPLAGPGRQLLRRFPALREHRDFGRANPGITVVVF